MGFRMYIYQENSTNKHEIESPKLYGYVKERPLASIYYLKTIIKDFDYEELCYGIGYGPIRLTEKEYKIFIILYLDDLFGDELFDFKRLNDYSKKFITKSKALICMPGDKYLEWW